MHEYAALLPLVLLLAGCGMLYKALGGGWYES